MSNDLISVLRTDLLMAMDELRQAGRDYPADLLKKALFSAPVGAEPVGLSVEVRTLGSYGKAFDLPGNRRAYTYDHQPGNVEASRLGNACQQAAAASAGDTIDRGLGLLKELQAQGFGVFDAESSRWHAAPVAAPVNAEPVSHPTEAIMGYRMEFKPGEYCYYTPEGYALEAYKGDAPTHALYANPQPGCPSEIEVYKGRCWVRPKYNFGNIVDETFRPLFLGPQLGPPVSYQPGLTQQTLDDVKAGIPARDAEIKALRTELETLQAQQDATLANIEVFVACDASAISYVSLGEYRTALLKMLRQAPAEKEPGA